MKKFLHYLLTLAAFGTGLGAHAATSSRDLGYVTTSEQVWAYDGFSNPTDNPINMTIAIRLKNEEIGKYIGGSLTGMKIAWSSYTKSEPIKFWLRESVDGEDLASGTTTLNFDWNTVKFTTPYVIPEDVDEVWFGYDVVARPNEYCIATSVYGNRVPDVCYLINRDIYEESPNEAILDVGRVNQYGMILTTLTLEVDPSKFQNRVRITDLKYNPMVTDGSPATARMTAANDGMNNISRVTLNYKLGEKTYETDLNLSGQIPQGKSASFSIPLPGLGSGKMEITLPKVNGATNNFESSIEAEIVTIPEEVAATYDRRSLIEFFVDENEYRVPIYFTDYMQPIYNKYRDDVTLICRHVGDQFSIGDNDDEALIINLYGDDKFNVSIPAMALDRSLQLSNQASYPNSVAYNTLVPDELTGIAHVSGVFGEAKNVPTFAGLEVESDYNFTTTDGFVNISVNGTVADGVLPEGENLRLNVYLLEDNVYSNSQEFSSEAGDTRDFWHQAVIRQQPTPIYGEELDGAGDFTREYKVEIDPEWKAADMKVVAMLSRRETNNIYQRNVINVAEAEFDPGKTSITKVTGSEGSKFEVIGGTITVNGSADSVEVYNLAGARVANSQLSTGVYVVRSASEVAKIYVK